MVITGAVPSAIIYMKYLNMTGTTGDGAFFFKCIRDQVDGMSINHVNDALQTGTKEYSDLAHKTEEKFKCKGRAYGKYHFVGVQVEKKFCGHDSPDLVHPKDREALKHGQGEVISIIKSHISLDYVH